MDMIQEAHDERAKVLLENRSTPTSSDRVGALDGLSAAWPVEERQSRDVESMEIDSAMPALAVAELHGADEAISSRERSMSAPAS
jgi:hypothetical protein